jgi:hypothetical protein
MPTICMVAEDLWVWEPETTEACDRAKISGPCEYGENWSINYCKGFARDLAYITTRVEQVTCPACLTKLRGDVSCPATKKPSAVGAPSPPGA